MTCNPGCLILIPFPFSNLKTQKNRPVLALTGQDRHGDFIGLAVTTTINPPHAIALDATSLNWGSLPKPSWVRTDKIFTLDTGLIGQDFGEVSQKVLDNVLEMLCRNLKSWGSRFDSKYVTGI